MLGAVKKEARVRRDVERRLLQSIKLQIHFLFLLCYFCFCATFLHNESTRAPY
jgi:hypothetical protein